MGCMSSSTATYNAKMRNRTQPVDFYDEDNPPPPPPPLPLEKQIEVDMIKILQGLNQIKVPQDVAPVVCMGNNTYPIFLAQFSFHETTEESVELPIVAFSRTEKSKYVFFGSVNILQKGIVDSTETAAFLENTITWASDYKITTIKILLLGMPSSIKTSLPNDFHSIGYITDVSEILPEQIAYDVIFVPSSYPFLDKVFKASESGFTIFLFYDKESNLGCIDYSKIGLYFPSCSLSIMNRTTVSQTYEYLQKNTFREIIKDYEALLEGDEFEVEDLDIIVSKLRYHISEIEPSASSSAIQILDASTKYLEKVGYQKDNMFCPTIETQIVAILLTELVQKIPASHTKPALGIDIFPGLCGSLTAHVMEHKCRIDLTADNQMTTGLWLDAGAVGYVHSTASIVVQIGSHSLCMLLKPGPWKRWPTVVTSFKIEPGVETAISTQFGGLVYLISDTDQQASVTMSGCSVAPFFQTSDPQTWIDTRKIPIPWGELETDQLSIVLPTNTMNELEKPKVFCDILDALVLSIYRFIGQAPQHRRRIVFDVDLPSSDPVIDDTIFLNTSMLPAALQADPPTNEFAQMLVGIAQSAIMGLLNDVDVELAIATCAVRFAFKCELVVREAPRCLAMAAPRLSIPLWKVYTEHTEVPFAAALAQLREHHQKTDDDLMQLFVQFMSRAAGMDLSKALDLGSKPGTLMATSSERLQMYVLPDSEI